MTKTGTSTMGRAQPSGFLRHVVVLMSWTVVAQLVSVASMLVLPRLFRPEQFGIFSVFSGVVVMLGIVAAARYEFAIGLPESDTDGAALFTLSVFLAGAVSLLSLLVFLALPSESLLLMQFPKLRPWWNWVALGVLCIGWYNAASYLALRAGRFHAVGQSKVVIAAVTASGQILAAWLFSRGDGSLIVPFLVGQLCGAALIVRALSGHEVWCGDVSRWAAVSYRYARFPKFVAPGSLLDGAALLLPVAMISAVLSPAEAGMYALADRTLKVPVTLVGSSVLQAFYKRVSDLRDDPIAGRRLLLRTWRALALLAVLPCLAVGAFGPDLFALLFGEIWRSAGHAARWLSLGLFLYFVSYPTSNVLVVNERVKSFLAWQTAQLLIVAGVLLVALHSQHPSLDSIVRWLVTGQTSVYLLSMLLQWRAFSGGVRHLQG